LALTSIADSKSPARSFDAARNIEITKKTVKFGSSVYQLKNVTGFTVKKIPRKGFPLIGTLVLILGTGAITRSSLYYFGPVYAGLLVLTLSMALMIAFALIRQRVRHGLSLSLNSGEEIFFVSNDENFLMTIVNRLYDFMEKEQDGVVNINMNNRSVTITGNSHGTINLGDRSQVS
jgi:hypothetical protein